MLGPDSGTSGTSKDGFMVFVAGSASGVVTYGVWAVTAP